MTAHSLVRPTVVAMSKVFLSYFRQRRSGCIVNMSSQGSDIPWRGISAYSASKGATNAFTDTLKEEVSSFGIRVMCVQPGLFGTRVGANLARPAHEIKDVPEYAEIAESHANYAINAGKEPGDPKKGADRIVQVMQEMEVPSRLVLGVSLVPICFGDYEYCV